MKLLHKTWFHYLVLLFGLLCIGWSAIFVKLAQVGGPASAFYRMGIASLAIVPIWLLYGKRTINAQSLKWALICGLFFAIDITLWNTSIVLSKASIATLLANLSPVWVGLGSIVVLKEKTGLTFWVGTCIALFGVAIIVGLEQLLNAHISLGSILAISASFFYAAYLLSTQKARNTIDTITFTTISMILSTLLLFVYCTSFGIPLKGYSTHAWLSLAGLGLISQLGGWLAINWALGYVKSTTASVTLLSQSVITALFAIPVLGETLTFAEVLGAAVVLAGVFLVIRKKTAAPTSVEPEFD